MEEDLREKIERFKIKAERFLDQDVFITDINNAFYFCVITFIGEDFIDVDCFAGTLEGIKSTIYFEDIVKFEKYKERGL